MRAIGLAVSATVLALSLLAHVLSFVPGVPISMSVAWPLHLGAMVVFGMTIIDGMRVRRGTARREGESLFAFWQRASNESRGAFGRLLEMVPLPVTVLVLALVAYTFVNFFAFGLGVQGTPGQKNGRYYLHDHGTHVRDLTRDEFIHYRALGVRGFSGHWMLFSAIPTVYFAFIRPKLTFRRGEGDAPPEKAP